MIDRSQDIEKLFLFLDAFYAFEESRLGRGLEGELRDDLARIAGTKDYPKRSLIARDMTTIAIESSSDWPREAVEALDRVCRAAGCPTLSALRLARNKRLQLILRHGQISSRSDYYIARAAVEDHLGDPEDAALVELVRIVEKYETLHPDPN